MRIIPAAIMAILIFQVVPLLEDHNGSIVSASVLEQVIGDMVIPLGDILVIENRTLELDGSLIVNGTMVMKNSSLMLIYSPSNTARVEGLLRLTDLDNESSTPDGSVISYSNHHLMVNCTGGTIECTRSEMDRVNIFGGNVSVFFSLINNESVLDSGLYDIRDSVIWANIDDPDPASVITSSVVRGHIEMTGFAGAQYEFQDITVTGSPDSAFSLGRGNLVLRDCTIRDANIGITLGSGSSLELRRVSVRSEQENFRYVRTGGFPPMFNFSECTFEHGANDLGGGTGNINYCTFNGSVLRDIAYGRIAWSVFRNGDYGITGAKATEITRNHFIDLAFGISNMSSGKVYLNGFIDVAVPYYGIGDGVSIYVNREGNYYSSYQGKDDGSGHRQPEDGIGDTQIPYLLRDMFPLMFDLYWEMPILPTIDVKAVIGEPDITVRILSRQEDRFIIQDSSSPDFKDDVRYFSTRGRTFIIPESENGTHYIRARAYNETGSRGWCKFSNVTVDRWPLPPVVVSMTIPPEGNKVNVTWRYAGEDVHKVVISYEDEGKGQSIDVNYPMTTVTIKGLNNGRTYEFEMYTWDDNYRSRDPSIFHATPMDIMPTGPPRGIQGEALSNDSIALRWVPPEVQDISRYQVLRSETEGTGFSIVHETDDENILTYVDKGLEDNATYYYGVRAIDDDGPASEMGGPIAITTKHVNNAPVFIGGEHTYYREEGDPPLTIDIYSSFQDPDGDNLEIEVSESDPFRSDIEHDRLIISPEEDQNGKGYVQLMVDDGEERVYYLLWVMVAPYPDPPRIVEIITPANNSILMPGDPVQMVADILDPDLPDDVLKVIWASDRDGIVAMETGNRFSTGAYLSPGIHHLMLTVIDGDNMTDSMSVTVAVSIWGFRQPLWNFTAEIEDSYLWVGGFRFGSTIQNDAGITLTFRCTLLISGNGVEDEYERVLVLGGGTDGVVIFQGLVPILVGAMYNLTCTVRAETMNGTFAGSRNATYRLIAQEDPKDGPDDVWMLQIASVGVLFVIILIGTSLMFRFRKNNKMKQEFSR
jgi:hypothetical protein